MTIQHMIEKKFIVLSNLCSVLVVCSFRLQKDQPHLHQMLSILIQGSEAQLTQLLPQDTSERAVQGWMWSAGTLPFPHRWYPGGDNRDIYCCISHSLFCLTCRVLIICGLQFSLQIHLPVFYCATLRWTGSSCFFNK